MKIKIEKRASPLILTFETDEEMCAIRWAIETCRKEYPNAVYTEQMAQLDTTISDFYRKLVLERG